MNFRERLEQSRERQSNNNEAVITAELDEGFSCEYFATDNIKSLPACLDLRLPNGDCEGLPYFLITRIRYSTDAGILIKTAEFNITISGRDLKRLYQYLLMHRVRYIQPNSGNDISETGLFVKEIRIQEID